MGEGVSVGLGRWKRQQFWNLLVKLMGWVSKGAGSPCGQKAGLRPRWLALSPCLCRLPCSHSPSPRGRVATRPALSPGARCHSHTGMCLRTEARVP